uniref:Uncharacterized protein n=1 Tax=Myripristis murdjan TaxID=586833 RepID=A0A667Z4Q9_9TELE
MRDILSPDGADDQFSPQASIPDTLALPPDLNLNIFSPQPSELSLFKLLTSDAVDSLEASGKSTSTSPCLFDAKEKSTSISPCLFDEKSTSISPSALDEKSTSTSPCLFDAKEKSTSISPRLFDEKSTSISPAVLDERSTSISPTVLDERSTSISPTVLDEKSTSISPTVLNERSTSISPTVLDENSTSTSPTVLNEKSTSISPTVLNEKSTSISPSVLDEKSTSISPSVLEERSTSISPTVLNERSTSISPTVLNEKSTSISPSVLNEKSTSISPTVLNEKSTSISPSVLDEKSTSISPSVLEERSTSISPTVLNERSTSISPTVLNEKSTSISPTVLNEKSTSISPTVLDENSTSTSPTVLNEKSTSISPSVLDEKSTSISPTKSTSISPTVLDEMFTSTSPFLFEEKSTSISPTVSTFTLPCVLDVTEDNLMTKALKSPSLCLFDTMEADSLTKADKSRSTSLCLFDVMTSKVDKCTSNSFFNLDVMPPDTSEEYQDDQIRSTKTVEVPNSLEKQTVSRSCGLVTPLPSENKGQITENETTERTFSEVSLQLMPQTDSGGSSVDDEKHITLFSTLDSGRDSPLLTVDNTAESTAFSSVVDTVVNGVLDHIGTDHFKDQIGECLRKSINHRMASPQDSEQLERDMTVEMLKSVEAKLSQLTVSCDEQSCHQWTQTSESLTDTASDVSLSDTAVKVSLGPMEDVVKKQMVTILEEVKTGVIDKIKGVSQELMVSPRAKHLAIDAVCNIIASMETSVIQSSIQVITTASKVQSGFNSLNALNMRTGKPTLYGQLRTLMSSSKLECITTDLVETVFEVLQYEGVGTTPEIPTSSLQEFNMLSEVYKGNRDPAAQEESSTKCLLSVSSTPHSLPKCLSVGSAEASVSEASEFPVQAQKTLSNLTTEARGSGLGEETEYTVDPATPPSVNEYLFSTDDNQPATK